MPATALTAAPKTSTTFLSALCVNVAAVVPVFLFGGLAVQISGELGMSIGAIGLTSGLYFAVSALTTIPAGALVERFGAVATSRAAVLNVVVALLAVAGFAHDTTTLIVLLLLAAPANGLGQLSSNSILSDWAPLRRKGLMFGAKQASVPLCTMLSGLAVPVIALTLGWRWGFVAGAVLALMAIIPLHGLGRIETPPKQGKGRAFDRGLLLFAAATCLGASAATPLGSYLTTYAVQMGTSESFAGLNLTIGGLAGVIARTGFGGLGDLRQGKAGGEFGIIVGMLIGGMAGIVAIMAGVPWLLMVGTAAAFSLGWAWPGLMNFAVTKRYPHAPAAATSITQTGVFAGGTIGPIAFGLIVEHSGWTAGWSVVICCMAAAIGFLLTGVRATAKSAADSSAGSAVNSAAGSSVNAAS
ncbi:MFS transporter [Glycomyces buryatensis]|uniref:MFS transporter n=1 Tax=Glycomyces buryatensis TaxID=2570927 RepID=UPI0014562B44|nr:MFS transporter [Glycomyces buryatensis]